MGLAAIAEADDWKVAACEYRMLLFGKGATPKTRAKAISQEKMDAVMQAKGKLPRAVLLRCRVRYFSDGAILGSNHFVRSVFEEKRDVFGKRLQRFGRALPGADWRGLVSFRDLKKEAIGFP